LGFKKTNTDRIKRIYSLCDSHFGEINSVGIKYHQKLGWIAEAKFDGSFETLSTEGETSVDALRKLKNRIKQIIKRYNHV